MSLIAVYHNGLIKAKEITLELLRLLARVFAKGFARLTEVIADTVVEPIVELPVVGEITNWDVMKLVFVYMALRGRTWLDCVILIGAYWLIVGF
jgi:hypothetical protein